MSSVAPSYIRADIKITRDQPTPRHRQLIPTPKKGGTVEGKKWKRDGSETKTSLICSLGQIGKWRVNDVEYSIFFTQPFICFP